MYNELIHKSKNNIEYQKAIEKFSGGRLTSRNGTYIIKEWDESLHPRDENGRFTSSGGFGGAASGDFASAVADAKATLSENIAWRVTAHTQKELDEDYPGAKLHITAGGSTVAVTTNGDIVSVCKYSGDTTSGRDLMKMAVENGGVKLDSYSGNHGFYVKCGFEPVSWCKWDDEYAPSDWSESKGCKREPVVFYKYTGNTSTSTEVNDFFESTPASSDYDAAQKVRDDSIGG